MIVQPKTNVCLLAICCVMACLPAFLNAQTSPPGLVFPKNNVVTSAVNMTFQWDTVPGALSYDIQFDTTSNLSGPSQNVITASFASTLSSNKKYYWRVKANTSSENTGWSSVWSFNVFSPSDIPRVNPSVPNLVTWYKADYGIHTDITGNYVTQWDDASGNNNHAFQNNSAMQPVLVANAPEINYNALLRFDGFNDYLDFTTNLSSIETVFWVIKEDATATNLYRVLLGDWDNEPDFGRGCCTGGYPGPDRYIYDDEYPTANDYAMNGTTRVNGTIVPAIATDIPTTMSIISTKTAGNCQAENFSNDRNIPESGGRTRVWWGDLAELVIFNDPLTNPQIALVEGYLRDKYAPVVNLGANIISSRICDTVTLSVGHYYKTVTWWNSATTTSVQVTTPGTYWVTAKDQFDRISTDTIVVQFVRPNVIQPATICHGDSIVWNTGLSNAYNFLWQDGSTNSSYVIKQSGNYWVKVTDNIGCTYQTAAVHIAVDSFPAIADLGPDTLICQGQSIGLISGASLATDYLWSTGEIETSIHISSTGMYRLTVSNGNGCQVIDSILVNTGANAANSNFSSTSVCFGLPTSFTDLSTISPPNSIVSWSWNFGDGMSDTISHPVHTYNTPGTYAVTLTTIADNLCLNLKTKSVKVYAPPQPFFVDSIACVNKLHHFEDASTLESGATVATRLWNFGDNSASTQQNPIHEFYAVDVFNVSLSLTDSRGCSNSFSRSVESVPPPSLPVSPNLLLPSNNVTLSNPSVLFDWQPSNDALYYSLQLASDPGFTNIVSHVRDIHADSLLINDLTIGITYYWRVLAYNMCGDYSPSGIRSFKLFEPSVLSELCMWLSSDRGISTDINGNVEVMSDISSNGNQAAQSNALRRPVFVENVQELNGASVLRFDGIDDFLKFDMIDSIRTIFWVLKEDSDATPFYRSLLGTSPAGMQPDFTRGCCDDGYPGTNKYIYDNDYAASAVITGTTRVNGNIVDPLQTDVPARYTIITTRTTGNAKGDCFSCDRPFEIATDQRYWEGDLAELIVFCQPLSDSLIGVVESYLRDKYAPPVNLGPDIVLEYGFCAPTTLSAGDRFISYLWSTGERTTSIQANGPGVYWVQARDIFGISSYDEVIISGGLNVITFADTLHICFGDSVIWDTQLGYDYSFAWQDGSDKNHFTMRDTGKYWVTVIDSFNCLITTDTVIVRIDSFSVQATLGPDANLCSGNRINLIEGEDVAVSYLWNNGSAESTIVINQTGNYSLTVQNENNCVASDTVHVNIIGIAPQADFSFEGICGNDTTQFTDLSTPPIISSWSWSLGDGSTSISRNPEYFYHIPGTYNVKLIVTDTVGCSQSITKPVAIYPLPVAGFHHDLVNCAADDVHFLDVSTVSPGQTITNWSWTLGDGNFVSDENPVHIYEEPGLYPVSLRVTTDKGCSQMNYKGVEIFPELIANIGTDNLCFDYPTNFFDNSPGFSNVSWYWDFGDHLGYSFKENPTYNYLNPGSYDVSLKVVNAIGCSRTVKDTMAITSHPTVSFDNPELCEKSMFYFSDNTATNGGDNIIAWEWSFGDNTPEATTPNPSHVYSIAGQYNLSLDVLTENGCVSSATKTVTVIEPPDADFTFSPTYGAAPITVHFTNLSRDGSSYEWNFGDDATSIEFNPEHTYLYNDSVGISLITSNLPGCSDTATKPFIIAVATLDIGVNNVIIEKSYNDDCSYFINMATYVQNVGTRNVTSFDILASNSNGGTIVEHWDGEFSNRQLSYQFNADFLISDCEQDVIICVEVMNPNDEKDLNPINDRSCITLSSEPVIIGPYPNPAKDNVNLDVVLPSKGNLKIYNFNTMGNQTGLMTDGPRDKGYHRISMETGNFSPGVYMLKIEFNDHVETVKYLVR